MRIRVSECDLCDSTTVASPSEDIVAYLQAAVSGVFFGREQSESVFFIRDQFMHIHMKKTLPEFMMH
ncbi:hypothetical protein CRM92_06075 [Rothia dentocariosa]|uniref:Uncharacterized protein n=1 Tax=Rothia dentocariosa TaxID=2047 RepID=A0A2A8D5J7_9MICC|nr:hypothetical protein CRM92_06075 [Rothia dentocariosa]